MKNKCSVCTHSYALPTKSTEVMLMPEQGTKMYVDAILKTHERVIQVKLLASTRLENDLLVSREVLQTC